MFWQLLYKENIITKIDLLFNDLLEYFHTNYNHEFMEYLKNFRPLDDFEKWKIMISKQKK